MSAPGTWRINVDRDLCIGSETCVGLDPGRFTMVDGHSQATTEEMSADHDDPVIDAANSCPVEAITVSDKETGDQVAPEL